jgi:hypothetical protein
MNVLNMKAAKPDFNGRKFRISVRRLDLFDRAEHRQYYSTRAHCRPNSCNIDKVASAFIYVCTSVPDAGALEVTNTF